MRPEALLDQIRAMPFRPFVVVTADGARFRVDHPEWIATAGGRTAVLMTPDDHMHVLDIALITRTEQEPVASAAEVRPEEEEG